MEIEQIQVFGSALWLLGAFPFFLLALPVSHFKPLKTVLLIIVRRGKLASSSNGKHLQFTVPQSFYSHWYTLSLLWTLFLLVMAFGIAHSVAHSKDDGSSNPHLGEEARSAMILLFLMEIHIARRLYESLFVSSYSSSAHINVLGYFIGYCYYFIVPVTLFSKPTRVEGCGEILQEFLTGLLNGKLLHASGAAPLLDFLKFLRPVAWFEWAGLCIYLWGSVHQNRCHTLLAGLRSSKSEKTYSIPRGDWFEWVSCAHYLAEIVVYASFIVTSGGTTLIIWLMFSFVVGNLLFAALDTHEWYLSKFEDYPTSRRAIFPFIC